MIRRLTLALGPGSYPYPNFGMEEYLLYHVEEEECILYLWQNEKTVVIGRNQNAWKECRREELEAAGGHLVRRLSGGGAVFHDLGNLNFTFITRKDNYDVTKQTEVILRAVKKLGVNAERTGRNDITVDGRKFSGNAYYETGDFCYHHGTILLSVDKEEMARYLNVSREKLRSKSVDSVKSRVANLIEFVPDLTVRRMRDSLEESAGPCGRGACPGRKDLVRRPGYGLYESRGRHTDRHDLEQKGRGRPFCSPVLRHSGSGGDAEGFTEAGLRYDVVLCRRFTDSPERTGGLDGKTL